MITYKVIRFKNFLATGNIFTEVVLDSHATTMIVGKNGCGKSTIIDAICFALFGKPFRKINKPDVVNDSNNKECLVELEFETAGKTYLIRRGLKPSVFEIYCDGSLVDQDSKTGNYQADFERNTLKCNFKSFTQICVLGSAKYVQFMGLTPAERRIVVEDLLDIQIFSTMNSIASKRVKDNKTAIKDNELLIKGKTEKVDYLKQVLQSLRNSTDEEVKRLEDKQEKIETRRNLLIEEQDAIEVAIEDIDNEIETLAGTQKRKDKITEFLTVLSTKRDRNQENVVFFQTHENCPVCAQGIQHDHKQTMIDSIGMQIADQVHNIDVMRVEIAKLDALLARERDLCREVEEKRKRSYGITVEADRLAQEHTDITDQIRKYTRKGVIEIDTKKNLEEAEAELLDLERMRKTLSDERESLDIVTSLLKDSGIKSRIIKNYVPKINKSINKYLSDMGFWAEFQIDENFEETIKYGYRSKFKYGAFSEGQKKRIDLAILWAFRDIAKLRNSVNSNLLIMDEILEASLDTEGVEAFLTSTKVLQGTNLIVISPKYEMMDKFDRTLEFIKPRNYSMIKEE